MLSKSLLAKLLLSMPAQDTLTLEEALDRARGARPQVVAAAATVDRARGTARIERAIPNPTTQYKGGSAESAATVTVSQPLSWLPRFGTDLAAGRAVVAGARADSAQRMASVAHEVRLSFYSALAAEERRRLATEQSAIADSLVRLADRRVAAGDISVLERDQIAHEAARVRLLARQAGELVTRAQLGLGRAIGSVAERPRPAGRLDAGLDGSERDPLRLPDPVEMAGLPELRRALSDSAAAAARLRSARIAMLPIPALTGETPAGGGGPLADRSVRLGFSLPLPLWSQGREVVAEARGAAAESAALAAETRLSLTSRVETARVRLEETGSRARFARDSLLVDARSIRERTLRLFAAEEAGILTVLEALRAEREMEQLVVEELLAFQEARAELTALLGRWE